MSRKTERIFEFILMLLVFFALCFLYSQNTYSACLGRSATSDYPNSVDVDSDPITTDDYSTEDIPNGQNDAIVKIETELGTLPKGAYADVKTRLDTMQANTASVAMSTGTKQFQIGISSVPEVGEVAFMVTMGTMTIKEIQAFCDVEPTGQAIIINTEDTKGNTITTLTIPAGQKQSEIHYISFNVPRHTGVRATILQIGSANAGSDVRVGCVYVQ